MIVLTKTFVPYEHFDLDIILKVMAAICYLNLADLNCRTNLPQASIQAVFIVLLFAFVGSTNIYGPRSRWPTWRSQEVKTSPIGIHVHCKSDLQLRKKSRRKTYRVHTWSVDTLGELLLPILELGHSDLLCGFYRSKGIYSTITVLFCSVRTIT